jgi:glycosyltransferase involved in cell wall biosynthesis
VEKILMTGDIQPLKKLKILVVSQYFWPENFRINDLVEELVKRGHEVTVLTGLPNYPEGTIFEEFRLHPQNYMVYKEAKVIRVPLIPRRSSSIMLVLNYLTFFISATILGAWKLRKDSFDSVFAYGASPIMSTIPALVIGRMKRAPVSIWILDLWPETLKAVGVVHSDWILVLVGKVVSWIYNRADYLLLQSKAFTDNVQKYCTRSVATERLVYFPSWAEDSFSILPDMRSDLIAQDPNSFTILFAGNLGESQGLPSVIDSAESLRDRQAIRWVFVGGGRMSEWLQRQVTERKLNNVYLLGRHPLEAMPALFATADALLVSLQANEAFEKTIPGKVQAYMASGKPILAMLDGEAVRVIDEANAGLTCRAGDVQAFTKIVEQMALMTRSQREHMGAQGKQYAKRNFDKELIISNLLNLFSKATRRDGKSHKRHS